MTVAVLWCSVSQWQNVLICCSIGWHWKLANTRERSFWIYNWGYMCGWKHNQIFISTVAVGTTACLLHTPTWKFLAMADFLSSSTCLNFVRRPFIWFSIFMTYWKSLWVRRFSTSMDWDMFCTYGREIGRRALKYHLISCRPSRNEDWQCQLQQTTKISY